MNKEKDPQEIWYLSDYNWERGIIVGGGKKNYKIQNWYKELYRNDHIKYVPKEKCAHPDELVCVVWETWRGVNGRGGYRVEREMYPESRIPAKNIVRQGFDNEEGSGRIREDVRPPNR